MKSAVVSVIVPFHNAAEYLEDALKSVRNQTLAPFECLMIDDSSADGSRAIAERFAKDDQRFRLIRLPKRQGVSAARNAGLAKAKGRWVTMLDADDVYISDRLQHLVDIGEEEQADLVFDDQIVTEYPRTDSKERAFGFRRKCFHFTQEDFFSGSRLFRRSFPAGYMKPVIRREYLVRTGVAFDPSVASGEDFLFYAQLFAGRPRCIAIAYAGYVYRRRRGSLSRSDDHLQIHAGLGDRVLKEFGDSLSASSRTALAARKRNFEDIAQALPALAAFRERRSNVLVGELIRKPRIAVTGLRLLLTRIRRMAAGITL